MKNFSFGSFALFFALLSGGFANAQNSSFPDFSSFKVEPKVLALAETVHSSSRVKSAQLKMIQELVKNPKFRILIIENPIFKGYPIYEALKECHSPSDIPVQLLNHPVKEDLEMLSFICNFNQKHTENPIKVRMDDIWDRPWELQSRAESLNRSLNLGLDSTLAQAREHCRVNSVKSWTEGLPLMQVVFTDHQFPVEEYELCVQALKTLSDSVASAQGPYDYFSFRESVRTLLSWYQTWNILYRDQDQGWAFRDEAQAQNILDILLQEGPAQNAILLTHTSHATKNRSVSDWSGLKLTRTTGWFLDQALKEAYQAIAITGYAFGGDKGVSTLPISENSLDLILHQKGLKVAWLDTSCSPLLQTKEQWFIQNENNVKYPNGVLLTPKDNFDGILFLDESPEGTPAVTWTNSFFS